MYDGRWVAVTSVRTVHPRSGVNLTINGCIMEQAQSLGFLAQEDTVYLFVVARCDRMLHATRNLVAGAQNDARETRR